MKRKNFLKALLGVAIAPILLANVKPEEVKPFKIIETDYGILNIINEPKIKIDVSKVKYEPLIKPKPLQDMINRKEWQKLWGAKLKELHMESLERWEKIYQGDQW